MNRKKITSFVLLIVFTSLVWTPRSNAQEWVSLFDGKTLNGWTQRGGKAKYEVKDNMIVGRTVPNTPNSFLCTDKMYGDFELELEFQSTPGAQLRCPDSL